jgi:hypothetical protein
MREPPPGAVFDPLTSYREYPQPETIIRSRDFAAELAPPSPQAAGGLDDVPLRHT